MTVAEEEATELELDEERAGTYNTRMLTLEDRGQATLWKDDEEERRRHMARLRELFDDETLEKIRALDEEYREAKDKLHGLENDFDWISSTDLVETMEKYFYAEIGHFVKHLVDKGSLCVDMESDTNYGQLGYDAHELWEALNNYAKHHRLGSNARELLAV